jgi:FKBP-type peptidyl-prolyl cis-trans isomerase
MSPAEKEARQMMADKKAQDAATKAYDAASTTPPKPAPARKMAKGGVTRADGCVTKGHTKGTMVKMAYGGKAC